MQPYGEEVQAAGAPLPKYEPGAAEGSLQGGDTFATYWRDEAGLDYADQRYYAAGWGRFLTADPYGGSANPSIPSSWNRYGYVLGDPVNLVDPYGLCSCRWQEVAGGAPHMVGAEKVVAGISLITSKKTRSQDCKNTLNAAGLGPQDGANRPMLDAISRI